LYRRAGYVVGIFRYPVKTMQGEELTKTYITKQGILGDRAYAVELLNEKIGQRKDPNKYSKLIMMKASYTTEPTIDRIPPAQITTPSGLRITTDDKDAGEKLSREIGMDVRVVKQMERPFHDSHPIHIITTNTLNSMKRITGINDFTHNRFRPSLLLHVEDEEAFPEDSWVGKTIAIGDEVNLYVRKRCIRCFVITLAQPNLSYNPLILRFVEERHGGSMGVNCLVEKEGMVKVGDAVYVIS